MAIESVVTAAVRLSAVFARLLRKAKPGRALGWSARERESVRTVAEALCAPSLPLFVDRTALRWQSLLDVALSRLPGTTRRRPDVLALTRDALALPEQPHTRALVDFAICVKLRELYRVGRSPRDLELLRQSFHELEESFEGRQRRRIKKDWGPHAHFLVDVVSMGDHVWRAPDAQSFDAYCAAFASSPFGVESAQRSFGPGIWPELFGEPPQFSSVLRRAYGIPLGVSGLDEALGALQLPLPGAPLPTGTAGTILLACGPSGSGRTTLLSRIAASLSALGMPTRFLTADESRGTLENRLRGIAALTPSLWSYWSSSTSTEPEPVDVTAIDAAAAFRAALRPARGKASGAVFLEGIAALPDPGLRGSGTGVCAALIRLRDAGACVFVSCTEGERERFELDRIADTVLRLGFHSDATGRHSSRGLCVDKTRLQSSARERHVLNVGEAGGCWVSPSLHTVNRALASLKGEPPAAQASRLVHRSAGGRRRGGPVSLRDGAHVLIHGPGPSGKAGLALACALAPAAPRTLVISFLHPEAYYRKLAARLWHGEVAPADALAVWTLYPGYIEPETFVSKLQKQLTTAELLGRPFGSVVLDGIHNLVLEFPLLRADDLLWPTIVRLLRANGIRAVSTFTSFAAQESPAPSPQDAFFPALVSGADTVLEMRRAEAPSRRSRAHVRVVTSSSDGLRAGDRYVWENDGVTLARTRSR